MNITERVEAYLDGELGLADKEQFEQDLLSNRELKQEFDLQNDMINAIREARKAELKTMLNNVPVGSGVGTGSALQYASAVVATVIIGLGIYYFWPDAATSPTVTPTEELSPNEEVLAEIPTSEPGATFEENPETSLPDKSGNEVDTEDEIIPEVNPAGIEENEQAPISTEDARPAILDNFDLEENSIAEIPENDLLEKNPYSEEQVEVSVNTGERRYDFHYQFMNNKLVLYGSFDETYEILDFMQEKKRSIYLKYKGKYYSLTETALEVKALLPVTDRALIQSLEQRRSGQ